MADGFNGVGQFLAGYKSPCHVVEGLEASEKLFEAFALGEVEESRFCHHWVMLQSSIREGLDSGATRINQRHKRNQRPHVLAALFL